jgi:hypothetical protein
MTGEGGSYTYSPFGVPGTGGSANGGNGGNGLQFAGAVPADAGTGGGAGGGHGGIDPANGSPAGNGGDYGGGGGGGGGESDTGTKGSATFGKQGLIAIDYLGVRHIITDGTEWDVPGGGSGILDAVYCVGRGGNGAQGPTATGGDGAAGGGGGQGGACAWSVHVDVSGLSTVPIHFGTGDAEYTSFGAAPLVKARNGKSAVINSAGYQAQAASCIGDHIFEGGSGGAGGAKNNGNTDGGGGGGGGGAGGLGAAGSAGAAGASADAGGAGGAGGAAGANP